MLSGAVRSVWVLMTVLSCVWAVIAAIAGDPGSSLWMSASGIVFFLMSNASHDDLDVL